MPATSTWPLKTITAIAGVSLLNCCLRMRVTSFHIPTWWHNWWYPRPHLSQTMISLSVLGWDFLQMTHRRSDSGSVSLVRSLNADQLSVSSPNLIKHCSVTRSTYSSTPTECTQKSLMYRTSASEYKLVTLSTLKIQGEGWDLHNIFN